MNSNDRIGKSCAHKKSRHCRPRTVGLLFYAILKRVGSPSLDQWVWAFWNDLFFDADSVVPSDYGVKATFSTP